MERFGRFGLMLWPSDRLTTLSRAVGEALARFNFGSVTMCDDLAYESTFLGLAKIAADHPISVGTLIAHPFGRNPLELASAFTSLSELSRTGQILAGIGSGGALQDRYVQRLNKPVSIVRETAVLLRTLFDGNAVQLNEFPTLSAMYSLKPAPVRLLLPPERHIPICIAAGGPNMARVAGDLGDGVIFSDASPIASVYGMKKGLLEKTMRYLDEGRARSRIREFEKIWLLTISIDEDEQFAIQQAKRSLSYKLAEYWYDMNVFGKTTGFSLADLDLSRATQETIKIIQTAYYEQGKTVSEVAPLVPDELVHQGLFTIAGTPEQCREHYRAALDVASKYGFTHYIIGLVEGSNQAKSLRLIAEEVLPHV